MGRHTGLGLALILLAGCSGTPAEVGPDADAGRTIPQEDGTFTLGVGDWAELPDAGLEIRLIEVADDSRCPVDVTCVWAGDAVTAIEVVHAGVEYAFGLHVNPGEATGPGQVEVAGYRIELESLAPAPKSGLPIPQAEYRAGFRVTEAD
jgi:hypothetical protein